MSSVIQINRRSFCRAALLSPMSLLAARGLALADGNANHKRGRATSAIVLWLDGAPSQLETFDPHPGTDIGGPTTAINTAVAGLDLAAGLPKLALEAKDLAIIRSMSTKEGEHERGRYLMKTGYRPNPSVTHPAFGAVCARELAVAGVELPRFISILSNNDRQTRGGYLGEAYDPFRMGDPGDPVPDVTGRVNRERRRERLADLDVIEAASKPKNSKLAERTLHREQIDRALAMMDTSQLAAFRVKDELLSLRAKYGDTPFGRGCLAARRLVQAGVRCVEVQLSGWDSHAKNFDVHAKLNAILDPAFAALVADLRAHGLLEKTLVICAGEFGRTPKINGLAGRDHWSTGFSVALAGGGIRGGQFIGVTDARGRPEVTDPVGVEDFFATLLTALGIDPATEHPAALGRPIKLSEGKPIRGLFA